MGAQVSAQAGETLTNDSEETDAILNRLIRSVSQKRRRTIHQLALITAAGGKCQRCYESFHPFVYDFHHRNPANKSYSLDRSVFGRKLSELMKEAAKCVLVCANCHREIHTFNDTNFLELSGVSMIFEEVIYESRGINT